MTNDELFDELVNNDYVSSNLSGELILDDGMVKCTFDGLYKNNDTNMFDYLDETSESDKEIILTFLEEKGIDDIFLCTETEIEETIYHFYVTN